MIRARPANAPSQKRDLSETVRISLMSACILTQPSELASGGLPLTLPKNPVTFSPVMIDSLKERCSPSNPAKELEVSTQTKSSEADGSRESGPAFRIAPDDAQPASAIKTNRTAANFRAQLQSRMILGNRILRRYKFRATLCGIGVGVKKTLIVCGQIGAHSRT